MNIETKIKEEATYWLILEKEGLNNEKKEKLNLWLKDENNKKAYNRIKFVHQMSKSLSKENSQILTQEIHNKISKKKLSNRIKHFSSAAAILLIFCFSAFKVYEYNFKVQFSQNLMTDKSSLSRELPDGSIIYVDAKTNLNIEYFNGKREVNLINGRAMFEVAKDENRPFIIKSKDINIEVIGTKFEVINKEDTTTINVENGVVKTYYSKYFFDKQNQAILTKAQSLTYSNEIGAISQIKIIEPEKIALWRENKILFDKTTLKEALEEFSKYSDISVLFLSKDLENYSITGEFLSTQLDIFIKTISKIYPIKIEKNEKSIRISKKF